MKKLIILTLSLLSVSCAQASQKPDQNFSPESHARIRKNYKESFPSNWFKDDEFKDDSYLWVKIEESAEDMQQAVYGSKEKLLVLDKSVQDYQERLINKYIKHCCLTYYRRNHAKQCYAAAILDIAARMKQNGFKTYGCDIALYQNFSPESHARKNGTFSNWFNFNPEVWGEIEKSAEDVQQKVYDMRWSKGKLPVLDKTVQDYQKLLIFKYIKRCFLKYDNPNDVKQCSTLAIRDIAAIMKQNGFKTDSCDITLDKYNK